MGLNIKIGKQIAIYSFGIGLVYIVFGLLELIRGVSEAFTFKWGISEISTALIYPDIFSGAALAIIGVIFLFGVKPQFNNSKDAISYLAVGTLLSAVFFIVYATIMGSHAIGWSVYNVAPETYADIFADWAEWIWLNDMRAGIWLFIFVVPSLYYTLKMWLSRKKTP